MIDGNLVLGLAAAIAVVTSLAGSAALLWVTRPGRGRSLPDYTPPVTILKPLKGIDEGLEENLRSFFQLDYPRYQLLFGVADPDDPAAVVVERLIAEHPHHDAKLVRGAPRLGFNPKVENLASMDRFRKYDYLLISDSNVRVKPSYLRETTAYLADSRVGLVSNIFAGVGETSAGGALENLQLNGFIAGGVALAEVVGQTCVVGKSMLMPGRVLEEIGGFRAVRHLLAEDQAIGVKVRKAGYRIALSHHVIDNVNHDRGLRWFLNRHSRWYKIRRRMAPGFFLLEPLSNLSLIGVVWALSDDTGIAWGGLVVLVGLGIARDALQSRWLRGVFPRARHLLLCPVKDLFLVPVWFDALVNNRVHWRGHKMLVGRWTRLSGVTYRRLRRARRQAARVQRRARRHASPPPITVAEQHAVSTGD
jgi:ceramide glucosyltransferase